jgi:hypothetical protein
MKVFGHKWIFTPGLHLFIVTLEHLDGFEDWIYF